MLAFEVGQARRHLERATDVELDGVEASVKAAEAGAAYRLTQARAKLDTAPGVGRLGRVRGGRNVS